MTVADRLAPPLSGTSPADLVRGALASRTPVRQPLGMDRAAAVLLPLFAQPPHAENGASWDESQVRVWLVRRGENMRTHRGEVSLPGGRPEHGEDLRATALRESFEEIGLPPASVDVLGALDDYLTVTGFVITPYVGWVDALLDPKPQAEEIARVFSVPLSLFARDGQSRTIAYQGGQRIALCYEGEGEVIWGATAAILRSFVRLLEPLA